MPCYFLVMQCCKVINKKSVTKGSSALAIDHDILLLLHLATRDQLPNICTCITYECFQILGRCLSYFCDTKQTRQLQVHTKLFKIYLVNCAESEMNFVLKSFVIFCALNKKGNLLETWLICCFANTLKIFWKLGKIFNF